MTIDIKLNRLTELLEKSNCPDKKEVALVLLELREHLVQQKNYQLLPNIDIVGEPICYYDNNGVLRTGVRKEGVFYGWRRIPTPDKWTPS